jgi:hypothetical protein
MSLPLLAIGVRLRAGGNVHFELELELQGRTLSLIPRTYVAEIRLAVLACQNDVVRVVYRVLGLGPDTGYGPWENVSPDQLNSILETLTQVFKEERRPSIVRYPNGPPRACGRVPVPYIMASVNKNGDKITIGYELNMLEYRRNVRCLS